MNPTLASNLSTTRCELAPLSSMHRDLFVALQTDAKVREFLGGPVDRALVDEKFARMLQHDPRVMHWAVSMSGEDALGIITLAPHHDPSDIEISYQFLPAWWGRGLASEAVGAIVRHAMEVMSLTHLVAETQAANAPSRKLLERLGFHPRESLVRFGEEQVVYAIDLARQRG